MLKHPVFHANLLFTVIHYEYSVVGSMQTELENIWVQLSWLKWPTCLVLCMEDNRTGGNPSSQSGDSWYFP